MVADGLIRACGREIAPHQIELGWDTSALAISGSVSILAYVESID